MNCFFNFKFFFIFIFCLVSEKTLDDFLNEDEKELQSVQGTCNAKATGMNKKVQSVDKQKHAKYKSSSKKKIEIDGKTNINTNTNTCVDQDELIETDVNESNKGERKALNAGDDSNKGEVKASNSGDESNKSEIKVSNGDDELSEDVGKQSANNVEAANNNAGKPQDVKLDNNSSKNQLIEGEKDSGNNLQSDAKSSSKALKSVDCGASDKKIELKVKIKQNQSQNQTQGQNQSQSQNQNQNQNINQVVQKKKKKNKKKVGKKGKIKKTKGKKGKKELKSKILKSNVQHAIDSSKNESKALQLGEKTDGLTSNGSQSDGLKQVEDLAEDAVSFEPVKDQIASHQKHDEVAVKVNSKIDTYALLMEKCDSKKGSFDLFLTRVNLSSDLVNELRRIHLWSEAVKKKNNVPVTRTLIYPFSAGDILYPLVFFYEIDDIVLISLETAGSKIHMYDQKAAVDENLYLLYRSGHFKNSALKKIKNVGILNLVCRQLKDLNAEVVELKPFKSGFQLVIRINNRLKMITYYSLNLHDKNKDIWMKKLEKYDNFTTFLKESCYLLHKDGFESIRNFLILRSQVILQDDTGFTFKFILNNNFKVKLFGFYFESLVARERLASYYQYTLGQEYLSQNEYVNMFDLSYNEPNWLLGVREVYFE